MRATRATSWSLAGTDNVAASRPSCRLTALVGLNHQTYTKYAANKANTATTYFVPLDFMMCRRGFDPAILRGFEARELRAQRLHTYGGKTDDQFRVVSQRLDADDSSDSELRMMLSHPRLERHTGRPVLVLCRMN